jgi:glycosyltransferase involved in cell wall biosynthesis
MRIGIIYSRSIESGSYIRASYIEKYLTKCGHEVKFIKPLSRLPFQLDFFISFFVYMFEIFFDSFDIILVIKSYPNTCIPAILKKSKRTKIILDFDDLDFAYRKGIFSKVLKFIQQLFPRFFDVITVHNENLRVFLVEEMLISKEKIFDLPQGVDLELFNEKNVDKVLRQKMNLDDKFTIVYTAHLDVSTDLLPIFKAFKLILKKIDNCVLLIVGGGPYQKHFEIIAKKMGLENFIIFTGYLKKELMPTYIALSDVCILFYDYRLANYYRTSMKIREYLAMEKPVVCNDIGELKHFKAYTYQSKTDVDDFAKKIIEVLLNGYDNRIITGSKFIKNNYSWEEIIKKFEKDVLINY